MSRKPAEEIEFLRDVIARQRAEIERLHSIINLQCKVTPPTVETKDEEGH